MFRDELKQMTDEHGTLEDKIGKLPKISSQKEALQEILGIAMDNRSHVMLHDAYRWMELKMKAIRAVARKGLRAKSKKN